MGVCCFGEVDFQIGFFNFRSCKVPFLNCFIDVYLPDGADLKINLGIRLKLPTKSGHNVLT
jgi:hypothetical protein